MSTKTFTFDPDAGVPVGVDLVIHTGSTLKLTLMYRIFLIVHMILPIGLVHLRCKKGLV